MTRCGPNESSPSFPFPSHAHRKQGPFPFSCFSVFMVAEARWAVLGQRNAVPLVLSVHGDHVVHMLGEREVADAGARGAGADEVNRIAAYDALCERARRDVVRMLAAPAPSVWNRAPDPPPPPDPVRGSLGPSPSPEGAKNPPVLACPSPHSPALRAKRPRQCEVAWMAPGPLPEIVTCPACSSNPIARGTPNLITCCTSTLSYAVLSPYCTLYFRSN